MKDVRITVNLGSRRGQYEVSLQLDDNITCGETLQVLLDSIEQQQSHRKGKWQLVETWRGCDRIISSKELMVPLYMGRDREEIKIYLKRRHLPSELHDKRRIYHAKAIKQKMKSTPASVLFRRKLSWQKLSCLHWLLQRELRQRRKKYRDILYKRLARREPLWTPAELTPLDILRIQLGRFREHNLVLSSQVADLNITSTDLRSQLNMLRQKSLALSEQLSKLEQEVKTKKEERERQGSKNMAQVQTELIKLKRELEVRNRLNTSQNAKLKAQKQLLKEKQQLLAEKKLDMEQLKLKEAANQHVFSADPYRTTDAHKSPDRIQSSPGREFNIRRTPPSSVRREQVMSSASKKRHSSIFEVKTRQLVEEESKAFRELYSKRLDFDEIEGEDTTDPKLSRVDHMVATDTQLQTGDSTGGHVTSDRGVQEAPITFKKSRQRQTISPKHVQFMADSLILNAALEGDLELLKQCTRKLGSCLKTSDKGATCLHNAVCSGNIDVACYLVEQGCDVNAQDIDGWTPLHCAVVYTNLEMIRYLVHQGASLFMMTKDGDTPLKIITEDYKSQKEEDKDSEKASQLVACLHYLADLHRELGRDNNGVVYTLFSRQAKDSDELGFTDGEKLTILNCNDEDQWWLAENVNGKQGLVPCTFLGPYKPSNLGTLL